jgi:UDP-N-acetylglucosamine 2-epimerase (non-hydrolysing)
MPEEVNRVLTDHASQLLFAPSETAVGNLQNEGITDGVHLTGDVIYDSILWAREQAVEVSNIHTELNLQAGEYLLATVHRAANTDNRERLVEILEAFIEFDGPVIFPAHPRTIDRMEQYGLWSTARDEITLIDPVGYFDFVALLDDATTVATDSGGVQKEAFFLGTPCVTLRDETEWVETVEEGWNTLVDADAEVISEALEHISCPAEKPDIYGDGQAATRIVSLLGEG